MVLGRYATACPAGVGSADPWEGRRAGVGGAWCRRSMTPPSSPDLVGQSHYREGSLKMRVRGCSGGQAPSHGPKPAVRPAMGGGLTISTARMEAPESPRAVSGRGTGLRNARTRLRLKVVGPDYLPAGVPDAFGIMKRTGAATGHDRRHASGEVATATAALTGRACVRVSTPASGTPQKARLPNPPPTSSPLGSLLAAAWVNPKHQGGHRARMWTSQWVSRRTSGRGCGHRSPWRS